MDADAKEYKQKGLRVEGARGSAPEEEQSPEPTTTKTKPNMRSVPDLSQKLEPGDHDFLLSKFNSCDWSLDDLKEESAMKDLQDIFVERCASRQDHDDESEKLCTCNLNHLLNAHVEGTREHVEKRKAGAQKNL